MIADTQAFTDNFENPDKVLDNIYEVMADYIAVGIDPNITTIFLQSQITEFVAVSFRASVVHAWRRAKAFGHMRAVPLKVGGSDGTKNGSGAVSFFDILGESAAGFDAFSWNLLTISKDCRLRGSFSRQRHWFQAFLIFSLSFNARITALRFCLITCEWWPLKLLEQICLARDGFTHCSAIRCIIVFLRHVFNILLGRTFDRRIVWKGCVNDVVDVLLLLSWVLMKLLKYICYYHGFKGGSQHIILSIALIVGST